MIVIENDILENLIKLVKQKIYENNQVFLSDDELILFLLLNNKEIEIDLK